MQYRWFQAHEQSLVNAVCFVGSTNYVLTAGGNDVIVKLHSVDSGGKSHLFPREHVKCVNDLDCVRVGNSFISGGGDVVVLWDLVKHTRLQKLRGGAKDNILACKYLDLDLVAACGSNRELRLYDLRQENRQKPVFCATFGDDNLTCLDYANHYISVGSADGSLYTVDVRNQTLTADGLGGGSILCVESTEKRSLVSCEDGSVRLFDSAAAKPTYKAQLLAQLAYKVTCTMVPDLYTDRKHIFCGSETGVVHHVDVEGWNLRPSEDGTVNEPAQERIRSLNPSIGPLQHSNILSIVRYNPGKNVLVSSGGDGRLHVWNNVL